jgi:hypothetical protein
MYAVENFKTKKAFLAAVKARRVAVWQPGGFWPSQTDGRAVVEGPHAPQPHRWYAQVELRDGIVISAR